MRLTQHQKSILIGTVLGDGYLQPTGKCNARLRLEQSRKQHAYLLWKIKQLGPSFQAEPTEISRVHPKSKREYHYVRYQSVSMPYLGKLRALFYPEGYKKIPDILPSVLDLLAFTVWYLDDGYYYARDHCAYLYLGRVSKTEAEIAQRTVEKTLKLPCRILDKKQKGFAIYFAPKDILRLRTILKQYIPQGMGYKLP